MQRAKEDWVPEEDKVNPTDKFFEEYEITDNVSDYVLASDIRTFGLANAPGLTPMLFSKKVSKAIDQQVTINKYVNYKRKTKSIDGKKVQVWVGIREKVQPPDYDRFKECCEREHLHLSTSEQEYMDGTDIKGYRFCPTIKTNQESI